MKRTNDIEDLLKEMEAAIADLDEHLSETDVNKDRDNGGFFPLCFGSHKQTACHGHSNTGCDDWIKDQCCAYTEYLVECETAGKKFRGGTQQFWRMQ